MKNSIAKKAFKKRIAAALMSIALILALSSCEKSGISTTTDGNLSNLIGDEETDANMNCGNFDNAEGLERQDMDVYFVNWIVDGYENQNTEVLQEITFDGSKIHLKAEYTLSSKSPVELGIYATLGGVRQSITVTNNGKKSPETQLYEFTIKNNEKTILEVEFMPNIGKKGETLELEMSDISAPSYLVKTEDPAQGYNSVHIGFNTKNIKVIFDSDAGNEEKICSDFFDVKISDVAPLIKRYCREEDDNGNFRSTFKENLNSFLYKESPSEIFDKDEYMVMYTDKEVDKVKEQPMTINLSGIEGKYRVAFFVNHKVQPVFDGCNYADVSVEKNKQTEIVFKIDTTKLEKYNHCYYTVYKLQDEFDNDNLLYCSPTEKFIVN